MSNLKVEFNYSTIQCEGECEGETHTQACLSVWVRMISRHGNRLKMDGGCSVWLCRVVGSCRIGGIGVVSLLRSCGRMSFLSKISGQSHASMRYLSGRSEAQQDSKFVFVFYRKRIDFVRSHLVYDVRRCFTTSIGCPIGSCGVNFFDSELRLRLRL